MPDMIECINVEPVCRKRLRHVVVTSRVLAQPVADKNNAFCCVLTKPRPKEPLARQFARGCPITTPFYFGVNSPVLATLHIVTRDREPYRNKSIAVALSEGHGYRNQLPGHRARGWALPRPQCP